MDIIDLALREDIGAGDITARATVPAETLALASMVARQPGVISGLETAQAVFVRVDASLVFTRLIDDGTGISAGAEIATVEGNARSILAAERVALNLIQRLSGVASLTAKYVQRIAGTDATIVDTRKTSPGMRVLEKAAVRHGGGSNHRFGLSDAVLIKDNHLAALGGTHRVERAVRAARNTAPHTMKIEVEVTNLVELREAIAAGADIIMLDNMDVAMMRDAVAITSGRALLEASGGINLDTVAEVAKTGVDLISVGALTHSAPSLDISLEFSVN